MNTYFEAMPIELKVELISKCRWLDVGNLMIVFSEIENGNELGKLVSFKEFGIVPKESYAWIDVFEIYYRVMLLGFNRYNIKHPIIDNKYDEKLLICNRTARSDMSKERKRMCDELDKWRLSLANSYGVYPSDLLRFLYREGIYNRSPELMLSILQPLQDLVDYRSIEDIIDFIIQKYGTLMKLPGVTQESDKKWQEYAGLLDIVFNKMLRSVNPDVTTKVRLLKKIRLLSPPSINDDDYVIDYLYQEGKVTDENREIMRTLIELYPEFFTVNLIKYDPGIFINIITQFNIDIPFSVISTSGRDVVIEYITSSGKYEQELSDDENRKILVRVIYDELKEGDNTDYFLKMVRLINSIMGY